MAARELDLKKAFLLRAALQKAKVEPSARAETLSLEKSAALFRALSQAGAL